jgi:hypothetical protein
MDIMEVESSEYLPHDVTIIVNKLVEIQRSTFENSAERSDDDYVQWPNPEVEHPTQYYPNWQIFRYPKKCPVKARF